MAYMRMRPRVGMGDISFSNLLNQIQQDINQVNTDVNQGVNDVRGAYVTQQAQNWTSLTGSPLPLLIIGGLALWAFTRKGRG